VPAAVVEAEQAPAPVPVAEYAQPVVQPPPPVVYQPQQPQTIYVQQAVPQQTVIMQGSTSPMLQYARGVPAGPLVCP
jgi:hypothetical protein